MKKCILSAIAGVVAMLVFLIVAENISTARGQEAEEYEHIDLFPPSRRMIALSAGTAPKIL